VLQCPRAGLKNQPATATFSPDPTPPTSEAAENRYRQWIKRLACVADLVEGGRKVSEVAAELEVSEQTIYTWRRQARIDAV
jgi:DNA-binding NarL/FixJ family response regulator